MKRKLQRALSGVFLLSLVLLAGCSSGSGLVGVPGPGQAPPPGPPLLPATDAGLAEHVPAQIIIGFVPKTDARKIATAVNGTVLRELRELNAALVALPQGPSLVDTIRKAQAMSGVTYAEPNYVYRAFVDPNDPFFSTKQWGPQKINAPAAWGVTAGNANSVVAVVDTGVSSTDPEFSGKMLIGTNCVAPGGVTDDDNGHGTHVAGIAAAIGDNGIGIAGIAWAASILPIKVLDVSGSGTSADVACGIEFGANFAASNPGKRVVENLSLGGPAYSQLIKDAVDSSLQSNVLVIAAAGNDGKATVLFPAGYPGVMAVGATTPANERATFSTYGSHLSVVAPGVDIYSTFLSGTFKYLSGTSMATPHVSGVAVLVRALNTSMTPAQVRTQIEQTATRLGGSGFNSQFGWGLVNGAAAVGTPVASSYGKVQVTVNAYEPTGPPVPGVDVILWAGTPSCSGLVQEVQTTQTSSGAPGVGTAGVAVFNAVPAGNYCATAVLATSPPGKGGTPSPFTVTAEATTNTTVTVLPVPPFPTDISGLYVANSNSIAVYPPGASGNVAPARTISGTNTGLDFPFGVALDSAGNLYAANSRVKSITVYPPGVSGNWPPTRTISGTSTGLTSPSGIALDSAGNLYVTNRIENSITVYPPGASGNVAPARIISGTNTGLDFPFGVALDSTGNLYVANRDGNSITVYPPGASGNVAPARTISGTNTGLDFPFGVALDSAGNLYITNDHGNSITVYPPGASGNVAPARTISGINTGLNSPAGIALDSAGNLYVTNNSGNSITVFAPGATGNVAPARTISGGSTGLSLPFLISVR